MSIFDDTPDTVNVTIDNKNYVISLNKADDAYIVRLK